eukprot:6889466-Pyramimonas_sp.AAC.1
MPWGRSGAAKKYVATSPRRPVGPDRPAKAPQGPRAVAERNASISGSPRGARTGWIDPQD